MTAEIAGLYLYSYLTGSVPTAYLIARLVRGIDIRHYGSGNVGGTNLVQHVGKWWLVPLGLFEVFIKGGSPVVIGQYLLGLERSSTEFIIAPLLAVAGHNWSIFLKFQGGRGLAVVGGTLLALSPPVLAGFLAVFTAGWAITRSSGVWTLLALALLPVWAVIAGEPSVITWYCAGMLALIVLKRLLSNWTPLPQDLPRTKAVINRLFLDRDVSDRSEWVSRVPGKAKQK
jgi:glycerol-3-phosphate acyltransferase PlsY